MKKIILSNNYSIYDSIINRINLYKNEKNIICVEIYIELVYPSKTYLLLFFENVEYYLFLWNKDYIFYTVDSYKLLQTDDGLYYCSFDPIDETLITSDDDSDLVICKDLKIYSSSDMSFKEPLELKFLISEDS